MKIVSVNVGLPREVVWKRITVQTAIFKEPVPGVEEFEQESVH
jgi:MOSC domain-containing protein YiiM